MPKPPKELKTPDLEDQENDEEDFEDSESQKPAKGVRREDPQEDGKGMVTPSSQNKKKDFDACQHRFRSLEKRREPGKLAILVRCRRCQRSANELYFTGSNSSAVFVTKKLIWLD